MAVSGWKVHMVWQDGNQAVTEDYYWTGASDDPVLVIYPQALTLFKARSACMGNAVVPITFRLSQLGTFRSYINAAPQDVAAVSVGPFLVATSLNAQQVAAGISNQQDGSADEANVSIIINAYSTPANHARKFFAGVPDVLVRTDPNGPWIVGVPSWLSVFNAYVNILIDPARKWAFKARTQPTVAPWAPVPVTAVLLDPGGTGFWGVVTATFPNPPITGGANLQLRGFHMTSRAIVNFNGTYQIAFTANGPGPGTTTYYLRGTQNLSGNNITVLGNARGVDFSLYTYTNIVPGKQTSHKRGNRVLASPGRRLRVQRVFS